MIEPAVITPGDARSLAGLDERDVVATLATSGVLLFRGFGATAVDFATFGDRFSDVFTCDPFKVVSNRWNGVGGGAGRVVRRTTRAARRVRASRWPTTDTALARFAPFDGYGLNPHNENSYLPAAAPDLVWFHCSRPASDGGATILVDGVDALDRLDASTASFLRDELVRYETTLHPAQWQATWNVPDERGLRAVLDATEGTSYWFGDNGELTVVYDATQTAPTGFNGDEALRSNLLSLQPFDRVDPDSAPVTADGAAVPANVLTALVEAVRDRTTVDLAAGDVLLIDNTRVMHGRMPFRERTRRIETRCSWLRDDLAPVA